MDSAPETTPAQRRVSPAVGEFAHAVVGLLGLYVWYRLAVAAVAAAFGQSLWEGGLLVGGTVTAVVVLVGLGVVAGVSVRYRGIDPGLRLPARDDWTLVVAAVVVPAALVAGTKLVGVATGVPYNSLTATGYGARALPVDFLVTAGLTVLLGVPSLVVVCQVLVQGGFRRVMDGDAAVVATTVAAGYVMTSTNGTLAAIPDREKVVGGVLFTLALVVAASADEYADADWKRYLGFAPVVVLAALVVVTAIAGVGSVAGVLFAGSHLAVVGLAAYASDRTDSLVVPALAYLTVLLADQTVVYVFEAGATAV